MIKEFLNEYSLEDDSLPKELNFFHITRYDSLCKIVSECGCNMFFKSNEYKNYSIYFFYGIPNYKYPLQEKIFDGVGWDFFPTCIEITSNAFSNDLYEYSFVPTDSGYIYSKKDEIYGIFSNLFTNLSIKIERISNITEYFRRYVYKFFLNNNSYFESEIKDVEIDEMKFSHLKYMHNFIKNNAHPDKRAYTCELIIEKIGCDYFNVKNSIKRVYIPLNCLNTDEIKRTINLLLESKDANDIIPYPVTFTKNVGVIEAFTKIKEKAKEWI